MNKSELDDKLLFELEKFEINDNNIDSEINLNKLKKLTNKLLKYEISKIGIDNYEDYERILDEVLENDNL